MMHSEWKPDPSKQRNWKVIGDPAEIIDTLYQRNEVLERLLIEARSLIGNMPVDLTQTDSMTLLWIAHRDRLIARIDDSKVLPTQGGDAHK